MKKKFFRSVGWCEVHNKHLYVDRGTAKQAARDHRGEHKTPFRCGPDHPGWFHIGGLHDAVIAGRLGRFDVYG